MIAVAEEGRPSRWDGRIRSAIAGPGEDDHVRCSYAVKVGDRDADADVDAVAGVVGERDHRRLADKGIPAEEVVVAILMFEGVREAGTRRDKHMAVGGELGKGSLCRAKTQDLAITQVWEHGGRCKEGEGQCSRKARTAAARSEDLTRGIS